MIRLALLALVLLVGGCARHVNESFDITIHDARGELERMADEPVRLERPVVVAGGFGDPGFIAGGLARRLREATGDDRISHVDLLWCSTFDDCADRLIRHAQREHPNAEEFDVVGVSMGGMIARQAAMQREGREQLRIVRLYTLASPHRGARLAWAAPWDAKARAMRPNSNALRTLDHALCEAEFELVCYSRLGDWTVGTENTAPEGHDLWWVDTPAMQSAHIDIQRDPRIIADIARRLRGEAPLTGVAALPLPGARGYDATGAATTE